MKTFDRSVKENKGIFFLIAEELTMALLEMQCLKLLPKDLGN